ncbi:hypothetical protein ILUMI_06156 [Ignelater luminosus]|uniref:UDP-glycosyltransferases domain-containing protein n=1 Tax=Ignelater luminosus TaxID=2038154 RepID=A0A8K0GI07_IGNLU|nr:hypothetical protein ILUMI_06156 [Ignelater luminosus]
MKLVSILFIVLFSAIPSTLGARILGIVPIPSISHQIVFRPIWKELSLRGHQLTVLTTDPIKDPSLTNLTEIDLHSSYKMWKNFNMNKMAKYSTLEMFYLAKQAVECLLVEQLEHPEVQNLIKNETESFDLLMVEGFYPIMFAFAARFNCPMIQMFSLDAPPYTHQLIGNPSHPVLNPSFMIPYIDKLSFFERLGTVLGTVFENICHNYFGVRWQQTLTYKYFGNDYPDIEDIGRNTSLIFVNTDLVFHQIRPLLPNIIQIGGGIHLTRSQGLPKDLQKHLDDASSGFIYFSLGSNVKSKLLSEETRTVLIETFAELPYTILWKFEEDNLPGKPNNVIIAKWFLQQDIFKHPNIKLFITQGGLQSMEEAIYNHIPMVGMPFFGDQITNIKKMVAKGLGLSVDYDTMDKTTLKNTILEVMNNPKYRNKVRELAELAQDQPNTGLERAIWWTEYVLRHKGAPHLRSPAIDLPFYQYFLLDVIGFCLVVILIRTCVLSIVFYLGLFSEHAFGARILGYIPTVSYSHQVAFHPLWRELSLRGHQVTVLTTDPINDPSLINLTEIDLHFSYEIWKKLNFNELSKQSTFVLFDKSNFMDIIEEAFDKQLSSPQVHALIKNETEHFDLLMVEGFLDSAFAFSARFKCPMIHIFSLDAAVYNYLNVGNPSHPVLNPDFMLPFSGQLSFFERLVSTVLTSIAYLFYQYVVVSKQQLIAKKNFGEGLPPVDEIARNVSLLFVNTDPIFHPIRPLLPNIIPIGGGIHLKPPKPLPKDLRDKLDKASNGFIYFSLGSNVKSRFLLDEIRKIILETFAELPYLVLWKFEIEDLLGKPDNVIISKWFPQQDILRHPNIKLFISQGGLQSMEEAVYNHIPIIGISFFGDQVVNVKKIVSMGLGLSIDRTSIDKKTFKNTILEVINNPKYRNKVKEVADLARDQPMTGLERAIWWTEYVLRHKGAVHLRSPAMDLPLYQYFLLDVIGFCLLIILVISFILIKLVKLLFKLFKYIFSRQKVKTQ